MCVISSIQHLISCSQTEISMKRGTSFKSVYIQLCPIVTDAAAAFNWESEAPSRSLQQTVELSPPVLCLDGVIASGEALG